MQSHAQRMSTGTSRGRVLHTLRTADRPLPSSEIASAVGLSNTAVRFHLGKLVADGFVRTGTEGRARPGRPCVTYRAVPAEAVDGARAYRLLAGVLAAQLSRAGDPAISVEAGRRWAVETLTDPTVWSRHDLRDPAEEEAEAAAIADRPLSEAGVARVMALLGDGGFEPRLSPGGRAIELHRCPFLELAAERAEVVCAVHLGFVRGVLERLGEAAAVRLTPVVDGSAPCLVHLAPAEPPRPDN